MSSAQNQDTYTKKFNHDASIWLCDGYSAAIRFISIKMPDGTSRLLAGAIFCSPLPHEKDHSFQLETPTLIAGQEQLQNIDKASLLKIVTAATRGELIAYSSSFKLVATSSVVEHSDLPSNDVWFANLNLMVTGDNIPLPTSIDRSRINGQLRVCEPAFDGLEDLCQWLGFNEIAQGQFRPYISITISPPIDLIFEKTRLSNDTFEITVDAHPNFSKDSLSIAVRVFPGDGTRGQSQIKDKFHWHEPSKTARRGAAELSLQKANSVFVMLTLGEHTFRRQWFVDPNRAPNNRLATVQHFDRDLKMIKQALLEPQDPAKFESGIASILFMMGFSAIVQIETNSPDLIVATPSERLVLVECTTRIADFATKFGKLVDRKNSLSKALQVSGHGVPVLAVLICALPRDQIAATLEELKRNRVLLIAREEIETAISNLVRKQDPDALVDRALESFSMSANLRSM